MTSHETPGKDPTGQDQSAGGPQEALSAASSPEEKPAEVELKLAGQADALEALWRTAIAPQATASDRRLISTYFDTSDLRLRRRGFSLRIRQDGTDFVQTVKSAAKESQSVMRRSEWSAPADGPLPDLRKLEDPQALDKIGLVLAGELKSIFTTDVTRKTKRYRVNGTAGEGALIEAALDTGEIRCDGKQEAICELELELLEGSAVALQQEASRFLRETPLQFQPLSKAERGFALALGERPKGCKAGLPRLTPEASVEEGLEGVLVHCVNHWLANHAAVLDGGDTPALKNIASIDTTTEGTIEVAIDTLANLTSAASLATVGTITTGTWTGTDIAYANQVAMTGSGFVGSNSGAGDQAELSVLNAQTLLNIETEQAVQFIIPTCATTDKFPFNMPPWAGDATEVIFDCIGATCSVTFDICDTEDIDGTCTASVTDGTNTATAAGGEGSDVLLANADFSAGSDIWSLIVTAQSGTCDYLRVTINATRD